ncbi:MAG: hypothetical protein EHM48_08860, partial [Planctomycetaceae bacterium]
MRKLILPALLFCLLSGCGKLPMTQQPLEPAIPSTSYADMKKATYPSGKQPELAGEYYHGDGLGMNLSLILLSKGGYSLTWRGCQGLNGTAVGTWKFADGELFLTPTEEEGTLKEHPIRHMDVLLFKGSYIFVRDSEREVFLQQGPRKTTCYMPTAFLLLQ